MTGCGWTAAAGDTDVAEGLKSGMDLEEGSSVDGGGGVDALRFAELAFGEFLSFAEGGDAGASEAGSACTDSKSAAAEVDDDDDDENGGRGAGGGIDGRERRALSLQFAEQACRDDQGATEDDGGSVVNLLHRKEFPATVFETGLEVFERPIDVLHVPGHVLPGGLVVV